MARHDERPALPAGEKGRMEEKGQILEGPRDSIFFLEILYIAVVFIDKKFFTFCKSVASFVIPKHYFILIFTFKRILFFTINKFDVSQSKLHLCNKNKTFFMDGRPFDFYTGFKASYSKPRAWKAVNASSTKQSSADV